MHLRGKRRWVPLISPPSTYFYQNTVIHYSLIVFYYYLLSFIPACQCPVNKLCLYSEHLELPFYCNIQDQKVIN